MSTINDLTLQTQEKLEETPDNIGVFWSVVNELRSFVVEAMNEAVLLTAEPEIRMNTVTTLAANQTLQTMPAGAVAIVRVEGVAGISVSKYRMSDLGKENPTWETDTGDVPTTWFPFGLTSWGIYPKLTAPVQVILTYLAIPCPAGRPYTGLETIPFQPEYNEAFVEYAAHVARLKEAGADFLQSTKLYDAYLSKMQQLSKFAERKAALRFTRPYGGATGVTNTTVQQ